MSELAVLILIVDSEKLTVGPDGPFPVITFDSDQSTSWTEVKNLIKQAGASKLLLLFSNETVDLPPHGWNLIDTQYRRYQRLYNTADILASDSPFIFLDLFEVSPLPELNIASREINYGEQGWDEARQLYGFHTKNWALLESLFDKTSIKTNHWFALSRLYENTYRFEEAYSATQQALSLERACGDSRTSQSVELPPPAPSLPGPEDAQEFPENHQGRLWLAHGLHAAKTGRMEQAATAFRMSYTESRSTEPLYYWADELMSQGFTGEEAVAPIESWLESIQAKNKALHLILLKHRVGLYERLLDDCEPGICSSDQLLTRIRFECLILAGRIAEAVLWFREQDQAYVSRYPIDALLCEMLLADNNLPSMASALQQYELCALQERAVTLRLFSYAEALQTYVDHPLSIAFSLYRNGYVMRSAVYFLQALTDNKLDQNGYRCLAEILYYRGAYDQSVGMFEYLLSQAPDDAGLRTVLALACLRQSEALLNESMSIFPSSLFLREEAEKVAAGIQRMEQSSAITRWNWAERRHFHG